MLLAAVITYACLQWWLHTYSLPEELERMEYAKAEVDFDAAMRRKDYRFIGLHGIGLTVPGAENQPDLHKKFGVFVIPGTSDCITSQRQGALQTKAHVYAYQYNRLLLKRIAEMEP